METLESLRRRIDTTENLQSIVRTMKSLAAVSIRQYERAADSLRDYSRTVELGLQVALATRSAPQNDTDRRPGALGLVVFGSDHGLCGRFNDAIADFAFERWEQLEGGVDGRVLALGGQAASRLRAGGVAVESTLPLPGAIEGMTETAREILLHVDEWRAQGVRRVFLLYNRRTPESSSTPGALHLLPVDPDLLERIRRRRWPSRRLPTFSVGRAQLLSSLFRQYFFVSVFRAGVESMASEHATRLASMQAAERNIGERLEEMNGRYRERRQQEITEEILDVVAGAEALAEGDEA